MSATSRIEANVFKMIFMAILMMVLMTMSILGYAQTLDEEYVKNPNPKFIGFSGKYGVRSQLIKSDIPELSQLQLLQEGGSISFIYGNNYTRFFLIGGGLYNPVSGSPYTVDLLSFSALSNFYFLRFITRKINSVEPYTVGGISYDSYRFFGRYFEDGEQINGGVAPATEPLLGKINTNMLQLGAGIEYHFNNDFEFLSLFVEAKYLQPFSTNSRQEVFSNTHFSKNFMISAGFSVGIKK